MDNLQDSSSGGRNLKPPLDLLAKYQRKNTAIAKAYLNHAEVAGSRVAVLLSSKP
jgi:hypothetical protein